jgi:hypothetical protein
MGQENVLVLALYDTEADAVQASAALMTWSKATPEIRLGGVGILVKDAYGHIQQEKIGPRQGAKGAGIGLLLGLIAAIPTGGLSLLPGLVSGAVAGGAIGSLFHKGFHELSREDAERINRELDAGHAVVGVLVDPIDATEVTAVLVKHGGTAEEHGISDATLQHAAEMTGASAPPASAPGADGTTPAHG